MKKVKVLFDLYKHEIKDFVPLSRKDVIKFAKLKDKGDRNAFNSLVEACLPLVVSIVVKCRCEELELLDLIQVGNMGLIKAVEEYDWKRGGGSFWYVHWSIKRHIWKYIKEHRLIVRVPAYAMVGAKKIKELQDQCSEKLFSIAEIASKLGISYHTVRAYLIALNLNTALGFPIKLDYNDNRPHYQDWTEGCRSDVVDKLINEQMYKTIISLLSTLSAREVMIIKLRFEIGALESYALVESESDIPKPHTLAEIGSRSDIKLTRERVRQIINRALEKLKVIAQEN